jgi:putative methionine-R-sulfoxide reductase with GAF domain
MMDSSQTPQTNLRLLGNRFRRSRSSVQLKISFWSSLSLILVSTILIGYSIITLRQRSIENSTREATAISESTVREIQNQLEVPNAAARTLAHTLSTIKDPAIPISLTRDDVNGMLRQVLLKNPSFLGTYTLWEPNAFDGLDSQYVRAVAHDSTGRFIPYWIRDSDGIIHTEALYQYEMPGEGDWYILPRSTRKEVVIAPVIQRIQDIDVVIASFVVPITYNDQFYGIAGVDAPIGFVQQLVDDIDIYDGSTDAVLFTSKGTLIAARKRPELSNQHVSQIYDDLDIIQGQFATSFSRISTDGRNLQIFSPLEFSGKSHWVLGLSIPLEKITAQATEATSRQIAIGVIVIILSVALFWFLAGQLVRPLRQLTDAAMTVSVGNMDVSTEIQSNDEFEVLGEAFNSMTSQLKVLFGTLEERISERTQALEVTAEISRRLSTILDQDQLLREVVQQLQSAFGYYHAHIYLYDESGQNLLMASGTGETGRALLARGHKIEKGRGLVGQAAESNAPVLVLDTSQSEGWLPNPLLPKTQAELAVPIAIGPDVLGVLDVQHNIADGLTQEDADLLQSIANQVAVAVQNARSYTEAQQRAKRDALLATLGQRIQSAGSVEDVLQVAVTELSRTLGARRSKVEVKSSALENVDTE